jgi:hypothetical protein
MSQQQMQVTPFTNFTQITPLQITYFSGTELASLSPNQIQSLTIPQIQALNTGVTYPLLPLTNVTTLRLFDVATNPNVYDHIWHMSKAGLLVYFSVTQIRAITSLQFQSIFPSQFASFTALQMNAFHPLCYVNMSQNQFSNCGANSGGLLATSTTGNGTPNLISGQTTCGSLLCYLNPDCFRTMTGTHITQYLKRTNSINYLNSGMQENFTPSAVLQLTGQQLSAFGCDVCGNIFNGGPDQGIYAIQALPCFNLGYITSFSTQNTITIYDANTNIITDPAKIVFQDLVARYLLCPNYVSIPQISFLTGNQLRVFTKYQLQIITTTAILYNNVQYNDAQIPYLSVDFIKYMPATESSAIALTNYFQPSSTGQTYVTNGPIIYTANVTALLPAQIALLNMQQVQAFNQSQIQALNQIQTQSLNIRYLTAIQLTYFNISYFTSNQIALLTAVQLSLITSQLAIQQIPINYISIDPGNLLYPLTPTQIGYLGENTSQILLAHFPFFSQAQTQALQVQYLTLSQISVINANQLSPTQISQLSIQQLQTFTTAQFQSLSQSQVTALTQSQIQSLTSAQLAIINSLLVPAQLTASQINQMTPAQLLQLVISNIPVTIISAINPEKFALLTLSQLTASQINVMTSAQWLAINLQQLSISSIQGMSPQAFALIPTSIFASLPISVFGSNFPAVLVQAITSNTGTVYGQAYFMTSQQVSALSGTNIGLLSLSQINSFTPSVQAVIQSILNNKTSCLSINIASFNSSVNSPCMNLVNPDEMIHLNYNAIVSVTFPIQQAMAMFQYRNETNGAVRIYIDSSKLSTTYSYGSCNSIYLNPSLPDFINTFSLQERPYIADNNKTIPVSYSGLNATSVQLSMIGPNNGLQWIGPVTSSSIPNETTIPLSWDYILNISKNLFTTWTSYTFFSNLYSGEKLLRQTINASINAQINSTLFPFDINTPRASLSNTMLIDSTNKAYSFLSNNSFNSNNVGILIYNYLFSKQPARFSNIVSSSISFPFFSGDSLNFTLTISPDVNQLRVNPGATIPPRVYLIKMIIQ